MIAHLGGPGGGVEDTVAELMLFASVGFAVAAGLALRRREGARRVTRAALLGVLAVAVGAGAFSLPHRLFGGSRPATTGRLAIVSPSPGDVVRTASLDVRMVFQGIRILESSTTSLRPDEGHVHLSLDGTLVSSASGETQKVDLTRLAPGEHVLGAELVAGDHGPFAPRKVARVTFLYEPG